MKLLGIVSLAQRDRDRRRLDDLDARESDSVTRSHLVIHLLDSSVQRGITILLIHVVVTCTTLIPHPDTEVLNSGWLLLEDLVDT